MNGISAIKDEVQERRLSLSKFENTVRRPLSVPDTESASALITELQPPEL